MWAHDAVGRSPSGGLPIGRTLSLTSTPGGQVVAEFEFLSDDPFAQRVKNAWDKGFLRAASVSWLPLETAPAPGGGWRDTRADLLEWSIVSVPADPDTVRESHRRMIDAFLQGHEAAEGWSPWLGQDQRADRERWPQAPVGRDDGAGDAASEGDLALSPDDYDDLTTALALLRDVVDGVQRSGGTGDGQRFAPEGPEEDCDLDLAEIRELVGAIRTAVHPH